jgi:hypothetical protein
MTAATTTFKEMGVMRKDLVPFFLIIVLALTLMSGCDAPQGDRLSRTVSASGADILKGATRVEVFRVDPNRDRTKDAKANIGGYGVISTGKEQGETFARRLADILLGNSVTTNVKKCGLQPVVAYRLWKDKQSLEVLVCFRCDVLWPHVVGEMGTPGPYEYQDFDPVRAKLLALTKEAFPDDKKIQALPEVRKKD